MRPDFAQGFRLSSSWLVWVGVVVAVITSIIGLAMTVSVRRDGIALVGAVRLTTSMIWWGAMVLLAFAQSARVLHRLRGDGIATLIQLRTGRRTAWHAYLFGMFVRLCAIALPPIVIVGATALTLASADRDRILTMLLACVVTTACFAATIAPVAMAALGGRSRAGGYLRLFAILTIPEIFSSSLTMSKELRGMTSIPSLLSTLISALSEGNVSRGLVATFILTSVIAFALGVVQFEWLRVEREVQT